MKKDNDVKNNQTEQKSKALNVALESIEKQFGKGSIMKLGDFSSKMVDVLVIIS